MIARILARVARLISGSRTIWRVPLAGGGQRIFFANHTSHLDFIVIWSALPGVVREITRPVAGLDYWLKGRVRRFLSKNVFNAILVARHPPAEHDAARSEAARAAISQMAGEMGEKYSLIVFPEGTRGTGEAVAPFKSGLYHLARLKPDALLVPVYLDNMNRILPKGETLPVPMLSRVIFGEPMKLRAEEPKSQFLERARAQLLRLKEDTP